MNSGHRYLILLISCFVIFVFGFMMQSVPPAMTAIMDEFQISHAQAGLLMTSFVLPGIALSIIVGILSDRYGPRLLGILFLILATAGCFVTALSTSFLLALLGRFISGTGGVSIAVIATMVVFKWFPSDEWSRVGSALGISFPIATLVAFNTLGKLAINYDWRFSFYICMLLGIVATLMWYLIIKGKPQPYGSWGENILKPLKHIELWKITIVWFFFNAALFSFLTWGPAFFEEFRGIDPAYAGFLGGLPMLITIPFQPIFGWVSDKLQKSKLLIMIGCGLMSVAFLGCTSSEQMLLVSLIFLGISISLIIPVIVALPAKILGRAYVGIGIGMLNTGLLIAQAFASPLVGGVADITGSIFPLFAMMSLFSAIGVGVSICLKTK